MQNTLKTIWIVTIIATGIVSTSNAGTIVAWGYDTYGEVSNAPTGTGFTTIAAGFLDGYALTANGSIAAWGDDTYGQVSNAPTETGFTAIAAGGWDGYALTPEPASAILIGAGLVFARLRQRHR